jgi:hypothetical protein
MREKIMMFMNACTIQQLAEITRRGHMNDNKTVQTGKDPEMVAAKRSYTRPKIEVLGPLHALTQSSGPSNGDAGQNMMQ